MATYQTRYLSFQQDGAVFYLFKMAAKDLLEMSNVSRYDSDAREGYQRPPYREHVRKIASYLKDQSPAVLPTAILAAISPVQIELAAPDELLLHNKIRIVDGQHRILGLRELENGYNEAGRARYDKLLETYEFPVILMAEQQMENGEYSAMEVEAFININSKGKKVKTDLAETLRAEMFQKTERNTAEYLALNTETELNVASNISHRLAKDPNSLWYQKIILADEAERKKPISVSAFTKAIRPIVQLRLSLLQVDGQILSDALDEEEAMITGYVERVWRAVCRKWPKCFWQDGQECNESYNICKGIGVFPIYMLYTECISAYDGELDPGLSMFINIINESRVSEADWLVGGTFTGMSSSQAIKKIVRYLKNEAME